VNVGPRSHRLILRQPVPLRVGFTNTKQARSTSAPDALLFSGNQSFTAPAHHPPPATTQVVVPTVNAKHHPAGRRAPVIALGAGSILSLSRSSTSVSLTTHANYTSGVSGFALLQPWARPVG